MGIRKLRNSIGSKIRNFRLEKGLSQEKFAEAVSLSREHISCIECGKYLPSVETLYNIADYLKIDIRDFFE